VKTWHHEEKMALGLALRPGLFEEGPSGGSDAATRGGLVEELVARRH
jgi:hypothetical protein